LIILVVDAAVKERLPEKRQMLGRLLARADTEQWGSPRIGRIEEALDALIRMSEGDLRVLRLCARPRSSATGPGASLPPVPYPVFRSASFAATSNERSRRMNWRQAALASTYFPSCLM